MRNISTLITKTIGQCLILISLLSSNAYAEAVIPSQAECKAEVIDPTIQGACIAIDVDRGNCMACHRLGDSSDPDLQPGNIGPPLIAVAQRMDPEKLRNQIWDATAINPGTIMPPFGRHGILTDEEIDALIEFLMSL